MFTGLKLVKRAAPHPLDPLSAEEVVSAANICRAYVAEKGLGAHRFNTITLSVIRRSIYCAYLGTAMSDCGANGKPLTRRHRDLPQDLLVSGSESWSFIFF